MSWLISRQAKASLRSVPSNDEDGSQVTAGSRRMSFAMTARLVWRHFFGRRTLRADRGRREQIITGANILTLARAVGATAILVTAIIGGSYNLLLVGLAFSMFFDFVDGQIARAFKGETVLGAQLDGIADRITAALVAGGIVSMKDGADVVIAATAVWIQFGVVDQFLTAQFLRFDLWSPDHFYQLEEPWGERVWRQNWSAIAKLASNLPIVLLALQAWWAATAISLLLIIFRIPGYRGVRTLGSRSSALGVEAASFSPTSAIRLRPGHHEGHRRQKAL